MRYNNIWILRVPEGGETEKGAENLFEEIMDINFPNLIKEKEIQVQGAQRVPNKANLNTLTQRNITITMS